MYAIGVKRFMNYQAGSKCIQYSLGLTTTAVLKEMMCWESAGKVRRLWQYDASLWTNADEHQMMGWLTAPATTLNSNPAIKKLAKILEGSGCTDLVLIGMGGASLAPELFSKVFGQIGTYPSLKVLDSTDPAQITHFAAHIDLQRTCFIIASKSGTTLETVLLKQHFYEGLKSSLGSVEVGERFIAITDAGSPLAHMADAEHFKAIFYGDPSIAGRYSSLSNFGMVPLGLMGVNVKRFLHHAIAMEQRCQLNSSLAENPGVALGIILGVCAQEGKNKITLLMSPAIAALGSWITQLIAESTGKSGKGLIPIDQEPLSSAGVYGTDRLFVYLRLDSNPDKEQDVTVMQLEQSGHSIVYLHIPNPMHLGAELFRWQIATAVASSVIGVHPFNQPDVEDVKVRTRELIDGLEYGTGTIRANPLITEGGVALFTDEPNAKELNQLLIGEPSVMAYLRAHFARLKSGDYVGLCAFTERDAAYMRLLQQIGITVRNHKKVATTVEFGPRFLHSTGQIHKGGPNTGLFLQITAAQPIDILVPEHDYSFGSVLKMQAYADFEALTHRARRFLQVHLNQDISTGLEQLHQLIEIALLNP